MSSSDDSKGHSNLTPDDILERMATTYATCRSYHDQGVVKTVFIKDRERRLVRKPFRTAFVRPDRFRFEYEQDGVKQVIVWRHGRSVRSWCRFKKLHREADATWKCERTRTRLGEDRDAA